MKIVANYYIAPQGGIVRNEEKNRTYVTGVDLDTGKELRIQGDNFPRNLPTAKPLKLEGDFTIRTWSNGGVSIIGVNVVFTDEEGKKYK